jgi:hypothetical protein
MLMDDSPQREAKDLAVPTSDGAPSENEGGYIDDVPKASPEQGHHAEADA